MMADYWQGKQVLVTGGAGFLGSFLIETLLGKGAKITCLDWQEEPWRLVSLLDKIIYIRDDIADWQYQVDKHSSFEVIFHLAAAAMPQLVQKNPAEAFRSNVIGTENLLRVARECKVQKIIFPSAGALYTNIPKYLPIDEKHPIDPSQSFYANSKCIGELLCDAYRENYNVPCVYFRLFNTFGPRQDAHYLIPSFIKEAQDGPVLTVFDETVRRDFNYVADIVRAFILAAESDFIGGPINLGTGVEHSVGEIARKIAAYFNVEVKNLNKKVFGPKRAICDNHLAQNILKWQPSFSLDEGIDQTVRAFQLVK